MDPLAHFISLNCNHNCDAEGDEITTSLKSRLAARWSVELASVSHYLLRFEGNAHAPTILRSRESRRSCPGDSGLDRRGCNGRSQMPPANPSAGATMPLAPQTDLPLPDCRKPSPSHRRRPPIRLAQVFAPNSKIRALRKGADAADTAALEAFYAERRGPPVWITDMGFSAKAQAVIYEIGRGDDWGLSASDFDVLLRVICPTAPTTGRSPRSSFSLLF